MTLVTRLAALAGSGERGVLFTVVEGEGQGSKLLVLESGERFGDAPEEAAAQFDEIVRRGRNRLLELSDGTKVFAEWYGPPPRLFVYGAVDTAEALAQGAKLLGWTSIVADARGMFLTRDRIPSADVLIGKWPQEALAEIEPDHQTAIVVLTHDDKFDEPALIAALDTEAFYVGALGSRRTQERRKERLREAGVAEEKLARIMGPCGLDVGADTQAETALSILAEVLAVRARRPGGSLREAKQRIHVECRAPGSRGVSPEKAGETPRSAPFAGQRLPRSSVAGQRLPPVNAFRRSTALRGDLRRQQQPQRQLAQRGAQVPGLGGRRRASPAHRFHAGRGGRLPPPAARASGR